MSRGVIRNEAINQPSFTSNYSLELKNYNKILNEKKNQLKKNEQQIKSIYLQKKIEAEKDGLIIESRRTLKEIDYIDPYQNSLRRNENSSVMLRNVKRGLEKLRVNPVVQPGKFNNFIDKEIENVESFLKEINEELIGETSNLDSIVFPKKVGKQENLKYVDEPYVQFLFDGEEYSEKTLENLRKTVENLKETKRALVSIKKINNMQIQERLEGLLSNPGMTEKDRNAVLNELQKIYQQKYKEVFCSMDFESFANSIEKPGDTHGDWIFDTFYEEIIKGEYNAKTEEIYKHRIQTFKSMCNKLSYVYERDGRKHTFNPILGHVDFDSKNNGTIAKYMVDKFEANFLNSVKIFNGNIKLTVKKALELIEKENPLQYMAEKNDYPKTLSEYTDFDKQMRHAYLGIKERKEVLVNFLKYVQNAIDNPSILNSEGISKYKRLLESDGVLKQIMKNVLQLKKTEQRFNIGKSVNSTKRSRGK